MELIDRPEYIEKLKLWQSHADLIKIVTGVRRCGKSKLFEIFQEYLRKTGISGKQIIAVNLEDDVQTREIGLKKNQKSKLLEEYSALLDFITDKMPKDKKTYIFLDEIQMLDDWQRLANTLRLKKNADVYLTGSNAHMFSSEMATLLGGRYIEIKMQPLSFKEYLSVNEGGLPDIYSSYTRESGFPQTVEFNHNPQMINNYLLDSVYQNTVRKDIIQRFGIGDPVRLDEIIRFMFDNIGNATSLRNVKNKLKSDAGIDISPATLNSYVKGLLDSYLMYKCEEYDLKGKRILESDAKYYAADIGLKNALLGQPDKDIGYALENVVYLELLRRGYDVKTGRVNTRTVKEENKQKKKTIEIDFVAAKAGGIVEYYQVAWSVLGNEETMQREYASLEEIKDNYPKYLLTTDSGSGGQNGIKRLNVLEWLIAGE
ncbi:MAG: ATP-binding protein [Treponema sp.]|nr:ATP-binding protein [Treponema sp.]MCL2237277.1 ATP-binding protein [Treponema sp.]